MGLFLDAAEEIKRGMAETGGTVLLVHHTGKDRQTIRGSSSVEAAMDTVYTTEGDPRNLRLRRTKRKDGPMEDMLQLRLVEVGPSAVLRRVDPGDREKVEAGSRVERSWVALATVFGDHAFTKAEAVTVLQSEEWGPLTRPTAYRAITDLVAAGLLNNVGDAKTTRFAVNRRRAKVRGLPDARPMLEGVGELDLPTVEELSAD